MENLVFSSRLVEGEYIDYDRLIPKDQPIEVVLDKKEFSRIFVLGRGVGLRNLPADGDYDIVTSVETLELFSRSLPFGIEKTLCAYFELKSVTLDENTALIKARDLYRAWCCTELEGAVVESEELSHRIENGKLILRCTVTAIEDITTRKKIEVLYY